MNFARLIVFCLASWLATGCAHTSYARVPKPSIPATEAGCKQLDGNWGPLGISGTLRCDIKTSDSGKRCTDSRECQGSCLAPEGTEAGVSVFGACSAYVSNFGNVILVTDGKADPYNVE